MVTPFDGLPFPDDEYVALTGLPVPGEEITCGRRMSLPKKWRRHMWLDMGRDFKNKGVLGIVEVDVRACARCGRDDRREG